MFFYHTPWAVYTYAFAYGLYTHMHGHMVTYLCIRKYVHSCVYGVATISRLLQIIGLSCRISSLLKGFFAKETYTFKEPTNRSHQIVAQYVDPSRLLLVWLHDTYIYKHKMYKQIFITKYYIHACVCMCVGIHIYTRKYT